MASIIRIKRSSVAGNPAVLAAGELAYSALSDNGSNGGDRLYVGIGTETGGNAANHFVVGGKYFTDKVEAATSANTLSTIVARDISGNFAAGTVTADITYNTAQTVTIDGDVGGSASVSGNGDFTVTVAQAADSVDLGTHTTGNYLASLADAGNGNITVVGSGTETAAATVDLTDTAVTAGAYGDATNIPTFTVDGKGRLTAAGSVSVATNLGLAGDSGTDTVSLLSDTLTVAGNTHVTTTVTDNNIDIAVDATDLNTISTIVARDMTGNFAAGTITADLQGNVTGNLSGDVTSTSLLGSSFSTVTIEGGNIDGTIIGATTKAAGNFTTITMAGNIDMDFRKVVNLVDPTDNQDAATKAYVDAVKTGLDVKESVKVATTASINLGVTGNDSLFIDGIALTIGDRVLVKNQVMASENGIYIVSNSPWVRSEDADNSNVATVGNEVSGGMFCFVEEGAVNADAGFVLSNVTGKAELGIDDLTFTQFSGAGSIFAGTALSKTGNTLNVNTSGPSGGIGVNGFDELILESTVGGAGLTLTSGVLDVVGTADRITANANSIDIASTYVGQTSITTLGTVSTGAWQGTAVGAAYGGTGLSSYSTGDLLVANGTSSLTKLGLGAAGKMLQVNAAGTGLEYGDVDGGTY